MNLRRLIFLCLSAAGFAFVMLGLFNDTTAWMVVGFILMPLGLIGSIMTRGRCSSCNAYLVDAEKSTCDKCESTLTKHLPRLAVQIKTR